MRLKAVIYRMQSQAFPLNYQTIVLYEIAYNNKSGTKDQILIRSFLA